MQPNISARITAALDPEDGTPLYHQLAAVVRWEISHGRLPIGAMLPPIREIAAQAGVNYHTVRRAWGELEDEGVISQRRGRGARVTRVPQRGGWSPAGPEPDRGIGQARIWVVAGALELAAQLAEQLSGRWRVEAIPWPLTAEAPPPGPILCTNGLTDEAHERWPGREGDLRPIPTTLSQATLGVLRRNAALLGVRRVVIHADAADVAARELTRQLPRLGLQATLGQDSQAGAEPETSIDALVLHFPGAWQRLDWATRAHPCSVLAALEWAAGPLAGVAREQGWVAR